MTAVLVTLLAVVIVLVLLLLVEMMRVPAPARAWMPDPLAGGTDLVEPLQPTILLFLTSSCTTCGALWRALALPETELPPEQRVVVVTKGAELEDRRRIRGFAPRGLPVSMSTAMWDRFDVTSAPFVVVVDGAGKVVARGAVSSWADVAALGRDATRVP